jgi:predicted ATP-grasp superfamily ATP-dependent carboligase
MQEKKVNKNAVYIKAALSGIAVGLIIFMFHLFNERDKESSESYKDYYKPLVTAIENFKINLAEIYKRAETMALQTEEIDFSHKIELTDIIKSNINECDKNIKRLNSDFVPMSAKSSKNDMISFFNRARGLLERIDKTLNSGLKTEILETEFKDIEDQLEKISHIKISGYIYY